MTALRTGTPDPGFRSRCRFVERHLPRRTFGLDWEQVYADAEVTSDLLMGEVAAVRRVGPGRLRPAADGHGQRPGHDLEHLWSSRALSASKTAVLAPRGRARRAHRRRRLAVASGRATPATTSPASTRWAGGSIRLAVSFAGRCPSRRSCARLAPKDDDLLALRDELPNLVG